MRRVPAFRIRSGTMAKSSSSGGSGETKTPLVVALVFFILATLTLGVLTYIGFSNATKAEEASKAAATKEAGLVNERGKAQDLVKFYKVLVGTNTPEEKTQVEASQFKNDLVAEQTAFMNALANRQKDALTKVMNDIGLRGDYTAQLADFFKWPVDASGAVTAPPMPLIDASIKALGERQLAQNKATTMEKNYNDIKDLAQKTLDSYNAAADGFKKQSAEFPNKIAENAAKYEAANKQMNDKFVADMEKSRQELQKKENEKFELAEDRDKIKNRAANLEQRSLKAEAQLNTQQDPFQYDKPAGSITRRQVNSKQVEINLGSADNLRPGIKFSVQPSDTKEVGLGSRLTQVQGPGGKAEFRVKSKANIEVVEILGPHSAVARITEEFDEVRDRVMGGDLLYNSAWRKGAADHIALIGIFDLDADGIDDIQFVVNNLTKAGIVVDAYFDLGTGKWVGKVTERTIFAVEGYSPSVRGLDGNADVKSKIISHIDEAKKYCVERGAKVVKIRDFFPRIGYDVNLAITDDRINQAAAKYYSTQAKDDAPAAEKKDN
jgi:hypothetical protein